MADPHSVIVIVCILSALGLSGLVVWAIVQMVRARGVDDAETKRLKAELKRGGR